MTQKRRKSLTYAGNRIFDSLAGETVSCVIRCALTSATGWTVRGSNHIWWEIFRTRPDRSWGATHTLASNAEVKDTVEQYLRSPYRSSWLVHGELYLLPFIANHSGCFRCVAFLSLVWNESPVPFSVPMSYLYHFVLMSHLYHFLSWWVTCTTFCPDILFPPFHIRVFRHIPDFCFTVSV